MPASKWPTACIKSFFSKFISNIRHNPKQKKLIRIINESKIIKSTEVNVESRNSGSASNK